MSIKKKYDSVQNCENFLSPLPSFFLSDIIILDKHNNMKFRQSIFLGNN